MVGYQPRYAPVYSRRISPVRLGQEAPAPQSKLTPGIIRTAMVGGLLVETTLGAAGAWVGLYAGQKASGLLSIAGYVVGTLSAVSGLVSLVELATFVFKGLPIPQVPAGPPVQQPAVPLAT